MTPRVGDDIHWFAEHGLYDGLFLMKDEETGTFWDHMTGKAVYGPLAGESLAVEAGLVQTTVEQVLRTTPDALITLSDRAIRTDDQMKVGGLVAGIGRRLGGMFQSTVKAEDDRRRACARQGRRRHLRGGAPARLHGPGDIRPRRVPGLGRWSSLG